MFRHSIMKQSHLARKFDHMHKALVVLWIISYHIISYHIISYYITSYHIISYHIISYHIILYHIISYHILCSQTDRMQNEIYFIFSYKAFIWSDYLLSSERFLPNKLVQWVNNNAIFAWTHGLINDVTERSTNAFHHGNTATFVQALTVSQNRALPHWYRHSQYHTTEHCHVGKGTDNITQENTATVLQALKIPHDKALPHWYWQSQYHNRTLVQWYRHWQYHTIEHWHIGTDTHSVTQQATATLLQALFV